MIKLLLFCVLLFNSLIHPSQKQSQAIIPYQAPLRLPSQEEINLQNNAATLRNAEIFNTPAYVKFQRTLQTQKKKQDQEDQAQKNKRDEILSQMLLQHKEEQDRQESRKIAGDINFSKISWQKQQGVSLDALTDKGEQQKNDVKIGSVATSTFSPKTRKDEEEKIYSFLIHGTGSNPSSYGEKEEKTLSQAFTQLHKEIAVGGKIEVDMNSFRWSGALDEKDRKTAGQVLAREIIEIEYARKKQGLLPGKYWLIGHSHGCNVANNAAQYLKNHGISIDTMIFIAGPTLDQNPITKEGDGTYNSNAVLSIFGNADFIGRAGSALTTGCKQATLRKPRALASDEIVRNFAVTFNYNQLDHKSIKDVVITYLADIIDYINRPDTMIPSDIMLNIVTTENNSPLPRAIIHGAIDPKCPLNIPQDETTSKNLHGVVTTPRDYAGVSHAINNSKNSEKDFESKCGGSIFHKPDIGEQFGNDFGSFGGLIATKAVELVREHYPKNLRSEDDLRRLEHAQLEAMIPRIKNREDIDKLNNKTLQAIIDRYSLRNPKTGFNCLKANFGEEVAITFLKAFFNDEIVLEIYKETPPSAIFGDEDDYTFCKIDDESTYRDENTRGDKS